MATANPLSCSAPVSFEFVGFAPHAGPPTIRAGVGPQGRLADPTCSGPVDAVPELACFSTDDEVFGAWLGAHKCMESSYQLAVQCNGPK
jgi:hypothetical protein